VSLPDDVAEYLDRYANSSAVVTDAVRARMQRSATTRSMLEAAGYPITDEGLAQWREKLRPPTDAQRAESQRYLEALEAGHLPEQR